MESKSELVFKTLESDSNGTIDACVTIVGNTDIKDESYDQAFILDPRKANDFFFRNVKSSADAINRFKNRKTKTKNKMIDKWKSYKISISKYSTSIGCAWAEMCQ